MNFNEMEKLGAEIREYETGEKQTTEQKENSLNIIKIVKEEFSHEFKATEIQEKDISIILKSEEYTYFACDMDMSQNILAGEIPEDFLETLEKIGSKFVFTHHVGMGVKLKRLTNIFQDEKISLADFKKKIFETEEYKKVSDLMKEIQKIEPITEKGKVAVKYDGQIYAYSENTFDMSYGDNPEGDWVTTRTVTKNGKQIQFKELPQAVAVFFKRWI